MNTMSTMKVSQETKQMIVERKNHEKETIEDVLKRMIAYYDIDRYLDEDEIMAVKEGMDDIRAGRTISDSDLRKEIGF